MHIDRCICTDRPFADLIEQARDERLSLAILVEETGASACCSMCGPYLRRAYRTGRVAFDYLLQQDDEPYPDAADRHPAAAPPPS